MTTLKYKYLAEILLKVSLSNDHLLDSDAEGLVDCLSLLVEIIGGLSHCMLIQLSLTLRRYSLFLCISNVVMGEGLV